MSVNCSSCDERHQRQFVAYCDDVDIKDIHTLLVARNLEFTEADKLRFRSLRAFAPVHDQLFVSPARV